jgi:hypothetical protein
MPARKPKRSVPEYCSFQCPHAEFAPADTAGACRTMAAVYCKKLKRLVHKNTPCHWKRAHRRTAK